MTQNLIEASTLSLAGAQAMIDAARQAAESQGARVSIAVLDRGGHLVAFARMDGIHPGTVAVAEAKARTALLYNRPTEALAQALAGGNTAILTLPDLVALPGGVPVPGTAAASGAIGVSGAAPDVDEAIARAGAAAIAEG